jgi:hypothetical protein
MMEFAEKLDFLMNLTKTTNSMLAKHMAMDASYISRLRTGNRRLSKNAAYIGAMASYFARRCVEKTALEALATASGKKTALSADDRPEELILRWLGEKSSDTVGPVGDFLDRLSSISFRKPSVVETVRSMSDDSRTQTGTEVYYGAEGKRRAVIAFLNEVLSRETPRTLFLFSEENFDWLTESQEFKARWASLLVQVVMKGNRIRIIHSISRNLDEMLAGITEWLPIYMTGMVEPYYYPKTRDGIFQRTLFVAPGVAAILSTSVTGRISKTANYLIFDKKAVEAAAEEFSDYFELCRPLLQIYKVGSTAGMLKMLTEFAAVGANTIIKTGSLSILTMPEEAVLEAGRYLPPEEKTALLENHRRRLRLFEEQIVTCRYHELIKIPDTEDVLAGKIKIIAPDLLLGSDIFYTRETYILHLKHMISLLRKNDNYNVYIDEGGKQDDILICVREDVGVLVARNVLPTAAFAIGESKMTAAFWDYLRGITGKRFGSASNKKRVIETLEAVLGSL